MCRAHTLVRARAGEEWGKPNGFWLGSAVCLGVCWFLKLSACAVQQKFIGERLGSLLVVQQAARSNAAASLVAVGLPMRGRTVAGHGRPVGPYLGRCASHP